MTKRFGEGIVIGIISGLILRGLDKYVGVQTIKSLYQTFVVEMWPIWAGLIIAVLYWFINFLLDAHKVLKDYKTLKDWITQSPDDPNQWVSLDDQIRGTIRRMGFLEDKISEASSGTDNKWVELDKLQGLDYEEALGKLTDEERNEYLDYKDKEG